MNTFFPSFNDCVSWLFVDICLELVSKCLTMHLISYKPNKGHKVAMATSPLYIASVGI